jgi:hypothetical protein
MTFIRAIWCTHPGAALQNLTEEIEPEDWLCELKDAMEVSAQDFDPDKAAATLAKADRSPTFHP